MDQLKDKYGERLSENRLCRFLVGCNHDVAEAGKRIEKHLAWRTSVGADAILDSVRNAPFRLASLPHATPLRLVGLGLIDCVVNAGTSRSGDDVVHVEVLGRGNVSEDDSEILHQVLENYIGFFERRNLLLEQLSARSRKSLARSIQIRDVSLMGVSPGSTAMSMARKMLSLGMENYPECGVCAIFVNPHSVFLAIFGLIRRWLPPEAHAKIKVLSGADMGMELLRLVRPPAIMALDRLLYWREDGDAICDSLHMPPTWNRHVQITVRAREARFLHVAIAAGGASVIYWYRREPESRKSHLAAQVLFFNDASGEVVSQAIESPSELAGIAVIPRGLAEALLVLRLDRSQAWMRPHTFDLCICGTPALVDDDARLTHILPANTFSSLTSYQRGRILSAFGGNLVTAAQFIEQHYAWRCERGLESACSRILASFEGVDDPEFGLTVVTQGTTVSCIAIIGDLEDGSGTRAGISARMVRALEWLASAADQAAESREKRTALFLCDLSRNKDDDTMAELFELIGQYPSLIERAFVVGARPSKVAQVLRESAVRAWLPPLSHVESFDSVEVFNELLTWVPSTAIEALNNSTLPNQIRERFGRPAADTASRAFKIMVSPRRVFHLAISLLHRRGMRLFWKYENGAESPKSHVDATLVVSNARSPLGMNAQSSVREVVLASEVEGISLPSDADDGLLILALDHTQSFFQRHEFHIWVNWSTL